ncbi:MAG: single-stranded DNA-binding protein [bacterium]
MFNKVFLIGNLTRDPELRYTPAGIPIARFSVAVNRPAKKGSEGGVDFINCVAWRRLAEIVGEYLKKGRPVAIEGKLQIRQYEKDGEKRTISEVIVDNLQMLGKKSDVPVAASTHESDAPVLETKSNDIVENEKELMVSSAAESEEIPF